MSCNKTGLGGNTVISELVNGKNYIDPYGLL